MVLGSATFLTNFKTYGEQAFSKTAPRLWNGLPLDIRCSDPVSSFKSCLKTLSYFFNKLLLTLVFIIFLLYHLTLFLTVGIAFGIWRYRNGLNYFYLLFIIITIY